MQTLEEKFNAINDIIEMLENYLNEYEMDYNTEVTRIKKKIIPSPPEPTFFQTIVKKNKFYITDILRFFGILDENTISTASQVYKVYKNRGLTAASIKKKEFDTARNDLHYHLKVVSSDIEKDIIKNLHNFILNYNLTTSNKPISDAFLEKIGAIYDDLSPLISVDSLKSTLSNMKNIINEFLKDLLNPSSLESYSSDSQTDVFTENEENVGLELQDDCVHCIDFESDENSSLSSSSTSDNSPISLDKEFTITSTQKKIHDVRLPFFPSEVESESLNDHPIFRRSWP